MELVTGGKIGKPDSFLKRVLGRNSPFVIVFIEASRNFILDVFHKKRSYKKYCFDFMDIKNINFVTLSL